MGVIKLKAEAKLYKDVEHGDATNFEGKRQKISAEVIRHIVLGLPLTGRRPFASASVCKTTGAGISLRNAIIDGALNLDAAIGCHGGPLCPLEFSECTFTGHVAAAHAHFSRLAFRDCLFVHRRPEGGLRPTIDLTGARIDRQLDMDAIHHGPGEDDLLWIHASGACVGGGINLARCKLRAPGLPVGGGAAQPSPEKSPGDALDLTLARIGGDFSLDGGSRIEGRVKLRGTQIGGEMWLDAVEIVQPSRASGALMMQGVCIKGFLSLGSLTRPPDVGFKCRGEIDFTAAEIGRSLIVKRASIDGSIKAPDLIVRDDFVLHGAVSGRIELGRVSIGGRLDLSELEMGQSAYMPDDKEAKPALDLKDGKIGGALRLTTTEKHPAPFHLSGIIDLTGLACDTLDDGIGERWGAEVAIRMNHFTYRRTGWWRHESFDRKLSHRLVWDWIRAKVAETWWLPRPRGSLSLQCWESWQLRRNWIYRHFGDPQADATADLRRTLREEDYRPQPLEQAIGVARAEGREDFATHFEMIKQRIEWEHFNKRNRWWLAFAAITFAALWLALNHGSTESTFISPDVIAGIGAVLLVTLALMLFTSLLFRLLRGAGLGRRPAKMVLWTIFFVPALILVVHPPFRDRPFDFLTAFLFFVGVRFIGVFAHAIMRFGFGYLRRPVRAMITLIAAFILGWWGVSLAKTRDMFVVAAEPTAGQVAPVSIEPRAGARHGPVDLTGSERIAPERLARDVSCAHEISEPLYALDVLVPIVDLGEERRCEIRRFPSPLHRVVEPGRLSLSALWASTWDLPLNDNRFWWWMKAAYAIAGWILVSLALLTFAQVNRTHGEPAE